MPTWYLILTACSNTHGTVRYIKKNRRDAFLKRARMRQGAFGHEFQSARVIEWEPRYDGEWVEVGDRLRLDDLPECFPIGDEDKS